MYTFLIVAYVLISAALIGLVLIQHGKGADAGAAFGSGASGTVFGARGSANFLSRTTAWLAAAFFALSLVLAYFMHGRAAPKSVVDVAPPTPAATVEIPTPVPAPVPGSVPAPAAGASSVKPGESAAAQARQAAPAGDAKPVAVVPDSAPQAPKDAAKPAAPKVPE